MVKMRKKNNYRIILGSTITFVFLGLLFEYSYVWIKVAFSLIILALICLGFCSKFKKKDLIKYLVVILVSIFTAGASILASFSNGQIGASLRYGYNRECQEIVGLVDKSDVILINDIGWDRLPYVLRSENLQDPEWRWDLLEWVPKKEMLVVEDEFTTYPLKQGSEAELQSLVEERGISKIVYTKLTKEFEEENLLIENQIEQLSKFEWLKLSKKIEMGNKVVYVYDILYNDKIQD